MPVDRKSGQALDLDVNDSGDSGPYHFTQGTSVPRGHAPVKHSIFCGCAWVDDDYPALCHVEGIIWCALEEESGRYLFF